MAQKIEAHMRPGGARWRLPALHLGVLLLLLLAAIVISSGIGSVHLSPRTVLAALAHRPQAGEVHAIVMDLRLPRALAAAMVGAGLAVAGLLFQGLFRNPLADPFVLGSSGGAAFGGAVAVLLLPSLSLVGFSATALLAFLGSIGAIAIVYALASSGRRTSVSGMLLAGFAVATLLNAMTSGLVIWRETANMGAAQILAAWLHGQISVPTWSQLAIVAGLSVLGMAATVPLSARLNTLALGEDYARQLGINLERTRIAIVLTASLLTSLSVSLGGIISFVGLLIPHLARLILGPDHVRLLPVCILTGALFLVVADTFARSIRAPYELPVGMLTAFVGGPVFLYLLRRYRREVYL
jgi:iron complex transport system permease protein